MVRYEGERVTVLTRYDPPERDVVVFGVNGCLTAELTGVELYSRTYHHSDPDRLFAILAGEKIAPLIWLAMPTHDPFKEGNLD